jgi:hypothetical protein
LDGSNYDFRAGLITIYTSNAASRRLSPSSNNEGQLGIDLEFWKGFDMKTLLWVVHIMTLG